MSFLHPYVLLGLAVPLLLAVVLPLIHRRTGSAWRLLVSAEHPELVHRRPQWQLVLPPLLALLALAGLICAAARPINGYTQSEASSSGRNLLIALDISRSMETQDVTPSRLEEARAAAYELIEALPGDKIGLIVFSGEADVVVPLTYDHTALRDALEQVNRDWAGYGGTNFGLLLRTAMQNFARSAPEGANALVILSDGEDTVDSSADIAEEARKNHLLVITVGIGTPTGGPIPDPAGENGLWQDSSGRHVISKLDVKGLRRFSEATGGDFILMNSGTDLAAFAREAADKLERHEESYAAGSTPQDLFVWFAVPSLLALLAAILLSTEWRLPRRSAAAVMLLLLPALTPAAQAAEASAAQAYARALEAQQAGRDAEHLEQLSQALLSQDSELQAAAHLALGNRAARATFAKLRSLYGEATPTTDAVAPAEAAAAPPGIDALQGIVDELRKDIIPYRDALAANASLTAAQTNIRKIEQLIRVLEEEIERMKQEQQQQQQQQDKQDDKDSSKDQDDKDKQDDKDSSKDQDNKDKQDDKDSSKDQDNKDKQDDKDSSKGQEDKDKQDDKDSSKGQDNKDKQDDKDSSKGRDGKDKQDESSQGAAPQQPQDSADEASQNRPADARQPEADEAVEVGDPVSDDEKERRRAEGILRMHLDEEKGSPIPHFNRAVRPPSKDY